MTTAQTWAKSGQAVPRKQKPVVKLTEEQQRLAAENVRLAYDVVFRYRTRSVAMRHAVEKLGDDRAVSEALYGLTLAARGFDPERGFKFSTYAYGSIIRHVVEAGRRCGRLTERGANGRLSDVPALTQFGGEGDEDFSQESIPDGRGDERPYGEDELKVLRAAISRLPELDRIVLIRRFFNRETLLGIGTAMGVSKERIRQIQEVALARLRRMLVQEESQP